MRFTHLHQNIVQQQQHETHVEDSLISNRVVEFACVIVFYARFFSSIIQQKQKLRSTQFLARHYFVQKKEGR